MLKAGFINFMPFGTQGDAYYDYLKTYAEIGYKGFEGGNSLTRGDLEANLARVRSYGIEPIDIGEALNGFGGPEASPEEVVELCHKLGVRRITCFNNQASAYRFLSRPEPASYDEIMQEIETFEKKAAFYAKEGIDFMYHNHDTEFTQIYRGVPQYQLIAANTEYLTFELDCGWASYAGADPVKLIHQLGKRISALHVKDYQPTTQPYRFGDRVVEQIVVPSFTAVGSGRLDLYGCLKAGDEEGIEWAIVEQDFLNKLDHKQTLACAYYNMKETGFVE